MVCSVCRSIFQRRLDFESSVIRQKSGIRGVLADFKEDERPISRLALTESCPLCRWIYAAIPPNTKRLMSQPSSDSSMPEIRVSIGIDMSGSLVIGGDTIWRRSYIDDSLSLETHWRRDNHEGIVYCQDWGFVLENVEDGAQVSAIKSLTPCSSIPSIAVVADWIKQCNTSHKCRGSPGVSRSFRPSRLIHIESSGPKSQVSLCLCEGSSIPDHVSYVTLSHRWSQTASVTLTMANRHSLAEHIPLTSLSRPFHDAVELAVQLNVNYIWIDALCIVQDSISDWRHEASIMADVYKHAYCNIAITFASGEHGEIPIERDPMFVTPIIIKVEHSGVLSRLLSKVGPGDQDRIRSSWIPEGTYSLVEERMMVIFGRGWIFQELLLAPRVLYVGGSQYYWQCTELCASETHPLLKSWISPGSQWAIRNEITEWTAIKREFQSIIMKSKAGKTKLPEIRHLWYRLVEAYSHARLTLAKDKLVALSGIAERVAKPLKSAYLAGLWESNLLDGLLWSSADRDKAVRTDVYRAPTWSWASLDGRVSYGNPIFPNNRDRHYLDHYETKTELASVVEARTSTLPGQIFSEVSGGFIRLRTHLLKADANAFTKNPDHIEIKQLRFSVMSFPDVEKEISLPGKYVYAPLCIKKEGRPGAWRFYDSASVEIIYGLVLKKVSGGKGLYTRFGIFSARDLYKGSMEIRRYFGASKLHEGYYERVDVDDGLTTYTFRVV